MIHDVIYKVCLHIYLFFILVSNPVGKRMTEQNLNILHEMIAENNMVIIKFLSLYVDSIFFCYHVMTVVNF